MSHNQNGHVHMHSLINTPADTDTDIKLKHMNEVKFINRLSMHKHGLKKLKIKKEIFGLFQLSVKHCLCFN